MSRRRLETRRLKQWALVAVAVCAGALALVSLGGCGAPPAPPAGQAASPAATPATELTAAGSPCDTTNQPVHTYVIMADGNEEPKWVAPNQKYFKAKRGHKVLFVNQSKMQVTIEAKPEDQLSFPVFDEGDTITLQPHEHACRTISMKVPGPFPPGNKVELKASYEAPAATGQPVPMGMSAAGAKPAATKPASSAIMKPLGGPGMDIEG